MTWRELLAQGESRLRQAGISDARQDAWYLFSFAADMSREAYFLHMEEAADPKLEKQYHELLKERERHVPLQHLTGTQDFMGLTFRVNEHVLVPRQDTETLVEEAIKMISPGERVLDLCTGSGCILLSLSKYCRIEGYGVDISPEALTVARENAGELGLEAQWLLGDLFEPVTGTFDVIVSNPPYIPSHVIEGLMPEVRLFEPRIALDGSGDGLEFYRKIARQSGDYLRPGGRLLLEIGYDQGEAVSTLLKEAGFSDVCVKKDLCKNDRVVTARR